MLDKLKELIHKLNEHGIPLPTMTDPSSGKGSVSLTLVFLSSIYVQVGLIGKYSKLLEGVDVGQAINWFMVCAGLYFGRKLTTNKTGIIESNPNEEKDNK